MENNFLKQKFNDLHTSPEVELAAKRKEMKGKEGKITKPTEKIEAHLERLDEIFNTEDSNKREFRVGFLKDKLHDKFIIKPENIPESYYDLQRRIMREEGHGNVEITPNMKKDAEQTIVVDQRASFDEWIDYLSSEDATYPNYLKYFAFRGITKLGKYDKEKEKFANRTKETVAPFVDLDREALANVLDALEKEHQGEEQDDKLSDNFKKYLKGANFGKLYAQAGKDIMEQGGMEKLDIHDGEWIKYDQGTDSSLLHKTLQGKGTGWCTAGISTAETQIKNGDFYVYYTKNKDDQCTEPRIAIRMNGKNEIGEVRGVSFKQNLESEAEDILDEKLNDFSNAEEYKQKSHDMKFLTQIEEKQNNKQELTKEDLLFLYEVKEPIKGFGYGEDPRIEEIREKRNIKEDLAFALNCSPEQISITAEEALSGDIKFYHGRIYLNELTSAKGIKLPENISGSLYFKSLQSAEGLKLPESISGSLDLRSLNSAEGLKLPESIGDNLYLGSLNSAEGLELPKNIGGSLDLRSLNSAEGLKLPESIGDNLYLNGLISAEGLELPKNIGGNLSLDGLISAKGLELPKNIGGNLSLDGLSANKRNKLRKKYPNLSIVYFQY
jgi:hypothetical protein